MICHLRALGFGLAVVYLAGLVAAFAHESGALHVTCAEHGELTHLQRAANVSVESAGAEASVGAARPAVREDHLHCTAAALVRAPLAAPASGVGAPLMAPPAPATQTSAAAPRLPISRRVALLLAPKTSPPTRG